MVARRYMVTGRVQGVGYRNFVEHTAGKLSVDGYVRNRRDGSVEVFAMGTPEELQKLRMALERGPMMAQVSRVAEEPSDVEARYVGNFTVEFTE
ncbi:MAG TPA: acylphosphatase [Candidatus Acidoferrales bacterium]|jgi:acylphosphatase|nr:acylphosphatase [Candidatus Acidoferrales bacterium]